MDKAIINELLEQIRICKIKLNHFSDCDEEELQAYSDNFSCCCKVLDEFIFQSLEDNSKLVPFSIRKGSVGMRYKGHEGRNILVSFRPFAFIHNFEYENCVDADDFLALLDQKRVLWNDIALQLDELEVDTIRKIRVHFGRIEGIVLFEEE